MDDTREVGSFLRDVYSNLATYKWKNKKRELQLCIYRTNTTILLHTNIIFRDGIRKLVKFEKEIVQNILVALVNFSERTLKKTRSVISMRNTVGTWNALSAKKKPFKSSILLKRHQNIHTPEENRKCRSCEKVFSSKQALKRHIVVHQDDKAHYIAIFVM